MRTTSTKSGSLTWTALIFVFVFMVINVHGTTIRVPDDYPLIQYAINAAYPGDTVEVASGIYSGGGNMNLDFWGKDIVLTAGPGTSPVIDCEWIERAVHLRKGETSEAVIKGFTIVNGYTNYQVELGGGGILLHGSSATIEDCRFMQCMAYDGGAISAVGSGSAIVTNCQFDRNEATRNGGALAFSSVDSATVSDCTFSENSAEYGGALTLLGSSGCTISSCDISYNVASTGGGAYLSDSNPIFTSCLIRDNTASRAGDCEGGGIACYDNALPTFKNCIVTGNLASSGAGTARGGGFYCNASSPVIDHCTVADNSALGFFGDEFGGGMYTFSCSPTIQRSIFYGDFPEEIFDTGFLTPEVTWSDIEGGWDGEGNIDMDPLFYDPENNDYHLRVGSPCIDSADDSGFRTDFEGDTRPQAGGYDIGADEVVPWNLWVELRNYASSIDRGETLAFTAAAVNYHNWPHSFDEAVLDVTGPAQTSKVLYQGNPISVGPLSEMSAPVKLPVPMIAPTGMYTITVTIFIQGSELASDRFEIEVL